MKRLISIELQKIWLNRASRVLLISYFVIICLIALIAAIRFDIGNFHIHLAEYGIFNFPYIWHFNSWIASMLKLFLAVIIVSMMANEYSYGTLKQNLIDGLSKEEMIKSKFLNVILFSVSSTVFLFIVSLILGLSYSSYTEPGIIFSEMHHLLGYFLNLLGFFSFCLFVGILIKRSAFALGFVLLWKIAEFIFYGILINNFNKSTADAVLRYFPLESASNMITEPFTRLSFVRAAEASIGGAVKARTYDLNPLDVTIVCCWIVIFVLMSYKLLQKRDL